MAYPTPIVQIAFDDGPYVASPTWTDVTSYVRSMSINRGRSDDWGDLNGNATVVLNNRTRLFDPFYTSGTYYGKLLPRRQIRIRAETTELGVTTTHDVFRGFVDGFNPEWTDAGTDSTVTLSCFDALQLLATQRLPASWSADYILSLSPRHFWQCNESIQAFGNNTLKDYGTIPMDLQTRSGTVNGGNLAQGIPSRSVANSSDNIAVKNYGAQLASTSFSVSMWMLPLSDTIQLYGVTGNYIFDFRAFSNGIIEVYVYGGGFSRQYVTAADYDANIPRHYAFTFNTSTAAFVLYVNGVAVTTTLTSTAIGPVTENEQINIGLIEVQEIAVFPSVLTSTQVQTIYNYSQAEIAETSAARFTRILGETQFPVSLQSTASSPVSDVLDISYGGAQVTDELRLTTDSEGGPLFVSKNGTVTMFNQNQIFTNSTSITSQVTYGYGGTKIGETATIVANGDSLRNQAFVNMSSGMTYEKTNSTSVTNYGIAATNLETHLQTNTDADQLASLTTGFGGIYYPDMSPFEVVLSSDGPWKPTLDLELFQRITVKVAPPTGNVITMPMLVQRIQHDVVPGLWTTTLEGSQRWASVFILGTSTLGGTDLLG